MNTLDSYLNDITMYRLLVYGLSIIIAVAFALTVIGVLNLPLMGMIVSLAIIGTICFVAGQVLAYIWQVPANHESNIITFLILFCILPFSTSLQSGLAVGLASLLAIATKYLLAWHGRHIFNPAAAGVVIVGLLGLAHATWWVGSSSLWPYTLILGLLVARKLRRLNMVAVFVVVSLVVTALISASHHTLSAHSLWLTFAASPLLFLGTIMLTEPATMPGRHKPQLIYAALVAALYAGNWQVGSLFIYPETALVLGNVYAFLVSPKQSVRLTLQSVQQLSPRVYDYVFQSDRRLQFLPGQYMDWTLPHVGFDSRGNRRTFTIASSPTESVVHLGVKFYEPSSKFKDALRQLKPGQALTGTRMSGDFILPKGNTPLVLIAGGIGITPFRSMLKYLVDTQQARQITLLYLVSDPAEISFKDILAEATVSGVNVVPILNTETPPANWTGRQGRLSPELIEQVAKDYKQSTYMVSGPFAMVASTKKLLRSMSIPRGQIKTDYFSGY